MLTLIPEFSGSLSWLGTAVGWIIKLGVLMGSVGVGIILFTLFIKLVTMPFEIYSRVAMKKSSLSMEKVKPQLEKLKAQYKNDEATYRQKSMEIYKKNGFSPFKACLPILITLPLFFIIFSGFNNYSAWANIENYSAMAKTYNQSIIDLAGKAEENASYTYTAEQADGETWTYTQTQVQGDLTNGLLLITRTVTVNANNGPKNNPTQEEIAQFFANSSVNDIKLSTLIDQVDRNWYKKQENTLIKYSLTLQAQPDKIDIAAQNNAKIKAAVDKLAGTEFADNTARANAIIEQVAQTSVEEKYREINKTNRFLWVGNIWNSDVSYVHPISYKTLTSAGIALRVGEIDGETIFKKMTANLEYERDKQPNGFFIIIFLSAGALFASQFFITRQSKTQNDLMQGNGKLSKVLQWIPLILIPAMYIYFGFTYSMAYMLYLFLSSTISFVVNFIVNKIFEKKFMKNEEKAIQEQYNKRIPTANRKK